MSNDQDNLEALIQEATQSDSPSVTPGTIEEIERKAESPEKVDSLYSENVEQPDPTNVSEVNENVTGWAEALDAHGGSITDDSSLRLREEEGLLAASETAARSTAGIKSGQGVNPTQAVFQSFDGEQSQTKKGDLDMVMPIPVVLTVELGRTSLPIKHVVQLAQGSVVELDGMAGEPMDVLVNGRLIAQGEVVVVNDRFGVRLTDILTGQDSHRKGF